MNFKKLAAVALSAAIALAAVPAHAGVTCTETITSVIPHSNGNLYFTTSATCVGGLWCELNPTNAAHVQQGSGTLNTALITGLQVAFYWPNISSCTTSNSLYAMPDYLQLLVGS